MSRLRTAAFAAMIICALSLGAAGTASAQGNPPPLTKRLAITGTNKGKDFRGTYTIKRFASSDGQLVAVGTLSGTLKNRHVTRHNVRIPAAFTRQAKTAQIPTPDPKACTILTLDLRPLNLNLLGLRVRTSRIVAIVDAVPGPGNLLGNLLCAVTGLLDPQGQSTSTLATALNSLLALVPRTA